MLSHAEINYNFFTLKRIKTNEQENADSRGGNGRALSGST
jgi:hypothetical protein